MSYNNVTIEELKGKTLTLIESNSEEVVFTCATGERYRMFHSQDCCEGVTLESIDGDKDALIGEPIVIAKEEFPEVTQKMISDHESVTLTNFTLATASAEVTFKWFGSSNGYYSESVEIVKLP
jgi:hypothetical protein